MRIGILSFNQSVTDRPYRFTSKTEARHYLATGYHWVSNHVIQESFPNSIPSSSPSRHYKPKIEVTEVPTLNPPTTPMSLNLYYPVRDQSSYADKWMREVWGSPVTLPTLERLRLIYGDSY